MHEEAQYGIASHLTYKERNISAENVERNIAWIKELTKWQKTVAESDEFLEHLKMDFFKNRVFVFTPKGDVIDLPEDSTPIDFAYAIHSNIGDHLSASRVNEKLVSIETKLQNGDIVEIETKTNASPKRKWLDYTKTTLAKRHIKNYLEASSTIGVLAQKFFGKK
jgi:GTP diphosphokinase / guanosine-3',5'-bis(diphosphate) 3'-diphosphatase